MIKMPDIARYQNQPVSFGGGGNQTIPVAGRCAQRFPLCPEITGQDCGGCVKGQYEKVR